MGFVDNKLTTILYNNQSKIKLSKNLIFHDKTKYFKIDLYFTRQKIKDSSIEVELVWTIEQLANILTKALGKIKFKTCRNKICSKSEVQVLQFQKLRLKPKTWALTLKVLLCLSPRSETLKFGITKTHYKWITFLPTSMYATKKNPVLPYTDTPFNIK